MAEFGVQATQLSPPSGAGAGVVAPVQGTFLDNGVGKLLGGIADIFEKGLATDAKAKAQQQEAVIVGGYAKKLGAINDAVASGQIKPSEASARQRALHSEYVAGFSQYVEEIDKVRKSFVGGAVLGDIEEQAKTERDLRNQRIQAAQAAGFPISTGMDDKVIDSFIETHQVAVRTDAEFQRQVRKNEEDRASGRWSNEVLAQENKSKSLTLINAIAEANVNSSSEYARDLSARVKSGKIPLEDAQLQWNSYMMRLNSQIQSSAGLDPSLAAPYRTLFDDMNKLGSQLLDPANDAKKVEDEIKVVIGKQKLNALVQPNISQGVALTQLFGNVPEIALKYSADIVNATNKMSATPIGSTSPVDPIIGNPEREKAAFDIVKSGIASLRDPKKNTPEMHQGIVNMINNSLAQVGDTIGRSGVDAKYLNNVASFIASPEYGEYASKNKLDPSANAAAARVFQTIYEPTVVGAIRRDLDSKFTVRTPVQPAYIGAPLVKSEEKSFNISNLSVNFTGSGVVFGMKTIPNEPTERANANQVLNSLRNSQEAVNKLVHIGAHMEGSVNYAKYWEERKHILLPNLFSKYENLEIGQKVGDKTYTGGDANDPANWK